MAGFLAQARAAEPAAAELPGAEPLSARSGTESRAATKRENGAPLESPTYYIREYRVKGAKQLPVLEVENAVYPFLGPGRTERDIEAARASLERAYQDQGFQTVAVQVPQQQVNHGIVRLEVVERTVGRLRVKGARYFSPEQIKAGAPSLAEGKVVNFNDVPRDIVALNQLPDRQVTPSLRAGVAPNTVDVDLEVADKLPVHAGGELNNRHSANTTALRVNGSISATNLWQAGHAAGFNFQLAPQRLADAKIFSAYYLARFPGADAFSLMLLGTKQDSDVNTLSGGSTFTSISRGESASLRANFNLPGSAGFYQSASFGIDYKHFDQQVNAGDTSTEIDHTRPRFYPLELAYNAGWLGAKAHTEVETGVTFHFRGMGDTEEFNRVRYKADGSFIYLRGSLSHTRTLPYGAEIFARVQGQLASQPLLTSEQFSGGGLDTVRGYLESEQVGDSGAFGTIELRSSSLFGASAKDREWRFYAFFDGGKLVRYDPLPEEKDHFYLASYGLGSRIRVKDHLSGSLDAGIPLYSQSQSKAQEVRLTFRAGLQY